MNRMGLTVFYDMGGGGQYLSGAIAKALEDNVSPYTFKLDDDRLSWLYCNRWYFNTKIQDVKKAKVSIYIDEICHQPWKFSRDKRWAGHLSKIVKIKITTRTHWEIISVRLNQVLKNNGNGPDYDFSEVWVPNPPQESPYLNQDELPNPMDFEMRSRKIKFDIEFPYIGFYHRLKQDKFCNELSSILGVPVNNDIFSKMCKDWTTENSRLYKKHLKIDQPLNEYLDI